MQFADVACALKTQYCTIGIIVRGCPDCKMQSTKYGKRLQEPGFWYTFAINAEDERGGERYANSMFDFAHRAVCFFRFLFFILISEALPLLRGGAFFWVGFLKEENHEQNIDYSKGIYDARQLGAGRMLILGVQHMFAMFGATVLVPLLTGLSVSTTLLCAGLGTLLFHFITKRKVPAFLGFVLRVSGRSSPLWHPCWPMPTAI